MCREHYSLGRYAKGCIESCLAHGDDLGELLAGVAYSSDGHISNTSLCGAVGVNLDLDDLLRVGVAAALCSVAFLVDVNGNVAPGFAGGDAYGSVCIVRECNLVAACHHVDFTYECIEDVDCGRLGKGYIDAYRVAEYGGADDGDNACAGLCSLVFCNIDLDAAFFHSLDIDPVNACRSLDALLVAAGYIRDGDCIAILAHQVRAGGNLKVELLGTLVNGDCGSLAFAVFVAGLDGDNCGAQLAGFVGSGSNGEHIVALAAICIEAEPLAVALNGPGVVGNDACHKRLCGSIDRLGLGGYYQL